ncbi:MAG TPA: ABC transporter substrate-binding protein [Syntrophobacteraceae bacterium]|nr:ABC transporter substrate-binding protein [Syntrophobacteraceae bacterium]
MKRVAVLSAIALMLFAAVCDAKDKLKIGYMATMSGPGASLGTDILDGFKLGIEHCGGTLGGLPVDLIVGDDQLKPEVGVEVATRMVEKDKVDFVTGIVFSNVMMAVAKMITDQGVFLISGNAGPSPLAGAECLPNLFTVSWQNDQTHEAMGKYLQDKGVKRVYLMAPNYQAGKDGLTGFKRTFKGEIVAEVYTAVNQPDYAAELAQLRAAKPEAVFVFYPGGMGINFIKQYAQAGLKDQVPLYTTAFTLDQSVLQAMGDAALGLLNASFWSPDLDNPVNRKFVADFKKTCSRLPSLFAAQGYDAALLIDSAVRTVGGDLGDKEKLRTAFRKADFKSVRGHFRFNNNHFPIQDFYIRQVVKNEEGVLTNKIVAVAFKDYADAYCRDCPMKW